MALDKRTLCSSQFYEKLACNLVQSYKGDAALRGPSRTNSQLGEYTATAGLHPRAGRDVCPQRMVVAAAVNCRVGVARTSHRGEARRVRCLDHCAHDSVSNMTAASGNSSSRAAPSCARRDRLCCLSASHWGRLGFGPWPASLAASSDLGDAAAWLYP